RQTIQPWLVHGCLAGMRAQPPRGGLRGWRRRVPARIGADFGVPGAADTIYHCELPFMQLMVNPVFPVCVTQSPAGGQCRKGAMPRGWGGAADTPVNASRRNG